MIVDTHIESWRTRPLMLVGWTFKTHFHRKFAGDVRLLMPFLPRCGVILDIGANHGRYTLELSRVHSGNCRVLAFEPFDDNYRILSRVTRARKNVECFHTALSDQEDECELDDRTMVQVLVDLDLGPTGKWCDQPDQAIEAVLAGHKHHDLLCWHPAGPVPGEPPEFGGEFRRTLYGK